MTTIDIDLPQGTVRGLRHGNGGIFRAVPYAAPPIGEDMFREPLPAVPWEGVRDATGLGPTAPQRGPSPAVGHLIPNVSIPGDDYLHVNIDTPDLSGSLPVLVFIYGGSFVTGSNALDLYNGSSFSRDGVVYVALNYRLGITGFLRLDDAPSNRGLLDQIAALTWVRDNISRFGGDPSQVTVMGESAGAMSIGTLLAMPGAEGLFQRAILQSGACANVVSQESAGVVRDRVCEFLGVAPLAAEVAQLPTEALLAAQDSLAAEVSVGHGTSEWQEVDRHLLALEPHVDGESIPVLPEQALTDGAAAQVDILTGYTMDEMRLFFPQLAENGPEVEAVLAHYSRLRGLPEEVTANYLASRDNGRSTLDALVDLGTDEVFRIPARLVCESPGTRFLYSFGWESTADGGSMRAAHAFELPFVFDALSSPDSAGILDGARPQELADRMHAAWVDFITTGDPGWPAYRDAGVERRFGLVDQEIAEPFADIDARRVPREATE